ncbi:MAG: N-acetyl-gamma-glutamyl-phosphate reductase [Deferribacteraceae bacterium]|jgi:N-acetyl-gamma-glutamyl-phosphate reductase|nr:N-acetyl-gamma-glutamyl-phosphate reductase [Deferribacteraceae bacterium]
MAKVSVIGATGYTGAELIKIFINHPEAEIAHITSGSAAGKRYSEVYPAFLGLCDTILTDNDYEKIADDSDAVFLCLPHGASMDAAAILRARGVKVFDLSADYRLNDPVLYEKTYKAVHKRPDTLKTAVYGLAEIFETEIKNSGLVAVPGCYPTSVLIPLIPLLLEKAIDSSVLIADCKSGVSGAGKKVTEITHFCEANEDLKPYNIFSHRHKPEIDHILKRAVGIESDIVFTPHLTPLIRGMLSTIYTRSGKQPEKLMDIWRKAYDGKPMVRIRTDGSVPCIKYVAGTPFIDIAMYKQGDNLVIVSALDNLMKGASAQAVQCFNLCMGFNIKAGLL